MDLIKQLMEATLCPIEKPAAYGLYHWLFMIISIALMLTFCILMRNKSDKTFRIVMIVIGAVLLGADRSGIGLRIPKRHLSLVFR